MLAWAVISYGQTTRFVCAPNHPTARMMVGAGEAVVGPGRQLSKVPLWFRENALTIYKKSTVGLDSNTTPG